MENIASLMANLTDDQVTEYQSAKYPPSVRDWAKQEAEARIARRTLAQVELAGQVQMEVEREARKATIAKIAKALEKVWTDDLTNVLVTREEVDDTEHGETIYYKGVVVVTTKEESDKEVVHYPKVKALVVRTNIFWSETKQVSPTKAGKSETTKRSITVMKRNGSQLEVVGHFRNANEACTHLKAEVGKDSAMRVLQRDGYFTETYEGTDYTIAK